MFSRVGIACLVLATMVSCLTSVAAQAGGLSTGLLPQWRNGDLIFQQSTSAQSKAIRAASGSHYTHMGIIHLTPAGPVVIEASRFVTQTPLKAFIARGKGGHFAVYRMKGLLPQQEQQIIRAAKAFYGRPYDIYFRLDTEAIYCSELPYYAFQSIGLDLGRIERFADLAINNTSVKALFMNRWPDHPDCKNATNSSGGCWALMQGQGIITPASIAADPKLKLIFSAF